MKYVILYISHMKTLALVFLRYRESLWYCNRLCFTNENLATPLSSRNVDFLVLLKHISRQLNSTMKYGILCISCIKILVLIFFHGSRASLYFTFGDQNEDFPIRNMGISIFHKNHWLFSYWNTCLPYLHFCTVAHENRFHGWHALYWLEIGSWFTAARVPLRKCL